MLLLQISMMKLKHFLILVLICSAMQVVGQDHFVLKGKVVDCLTMQPLENACIHNLNTGMMSFSDAHGSYAIRVSKHDTLAISRVGFELEVLIMNDTIYNTKSNCFIRLMMKSIMLKNFTVYAMKPYPLFVKDIAEQKAPKEKIDVDVNISDDDKARLTADPNSKNLLAKTPLAHPISFLYEKFSRKAKMDRLYNDMMKNQDEVVRLAQKYNPQVVHRLTNLEGEQLDEFMVYCGFSYYILATATEVEIEQMILKKFATYQNEVRQ